MPKKKYFIIFAVSLISVLSLVSFSYFISNTSNDNNQKVSIDNGTMQLLYTDCINSSDCSDITGELKPGESITKTFSVKNTGTLDASYNILFEKVSSTFVNDELTYSIASSGTNTKAGLIPYGNNKNMFLFEDSLASGKTKEYTLTITWKNVESGNNESNINAVFNIKIGIEDTKDKALDTVQKLIKLNDNIKLKKDTPDYRYASNGNNYNDGKTQSTDSTKTSKGVYKTRDDKGNSYVFRGNIDYNYLKYAGFYWRIIRINGDGTLRLQYDGTSPHTNKEGSSDQNIGTSEFNPEIDDNAYAGYMYGQVNANSYDETHANVNDSSIKKVLDNWYKTNIEDRGYSQNVADEIFCNDRSISKNTPFNATYFDQEGYGTHRTGYGIYDRVTDVNKNTVNPSLLCKRKHDAFTADDTINGNGDLTYPVGLLSTDEEVMTGLSRGVSSDAYTVKNFWYWTMTPVMFDGGPSFQLRGVGVNGNATSDATATYKGAVVPVINLNKNIVNKLSGNGTMKEPFEISN